MVLHCNVPCQLQQCKCHDQDLGAPLYSRARQAICSLSLSFKGCAALDRLTAVKVVTTNLTSTQLHDTTRHFCATATSILWHRYIRRRACIYSSIPRVPVTAKGKINTIIACKTKIQGTHINSAFVCTCTRYTIFGIILHNCLLLQTPRCCDPHALPSAV